MRLASCQLQGLGVKRVACSFPELTYVFAVMQLIPIPR